MQLKIIIITLIIVIIIIIVIVVVIRILHKFCGTPTKTQIKADSNTNIHAINCSFLRMEDPCLKTHTCENIKNEFKSSRNSASFLKGLPCLRSSDHCLSYTSKTYWITFQYKLLYYTRNPYMSKLLTSDFHLIQGTKHVTTWCQLTHFKHMKFQGASTS